MPCWYQELPEPPLSLEEGLSCPSAQTTQHHHRPQTNKKRKSKKPHEITHPPNSSLNIYAPAAVKEVSPGITYATEWCNAARGD